MIAIVIILIAVMITLNDSNNCIEIAHAFSPTTTPPPPPSRRHGTALLSAEDLASIIITKERGTTATIQQRARLRGSDKPTNDHGDERTNIVALRSDNNNNRIVPTADVDEAKSALMELVPRMMKGGGRNEYEYYRMVEKYVNLLEGGYVPVVTLEFLNLAMSGEWQLLLSTNLTSSSRRTNEKRLRLRELVQQIEPSTANGGLDGKLTNVARWDYAEEEEEERVMTNQEENDDDDDDEDGMGKNEIVVFDSHGTFSTKCSYSIKAGSRMSVTLNDHELRPNWGSKIPIDIPKLVGYIHNAIPNELFDPNYHSLDTTYLDADLRIVRWTGPRNEGVRNIFIRKGEFGNFSPTTTTTTSGGGGVLE